MAKKKRGNAVNLDSFTDIMTCMLGILILMILLTGIDASQIKVLVPTPIAVEVDKRPIFVECRNNQLFLVPLEDLRELANTRLEELAQQSQGDNRAFIENLANAYVEKDGYIADLSFSLIGQFALKPKSGFEGYVIENMSAETGEHWFGKILLSLDPNEEMLVFLVRDDSFLMFKRARALAWTWNIDASCELLDVNDPLRFGLGGSQALVQ